MPAAAYYVEPNSQLRDSLTNNLIIEDRERTRKATFEDNYKYYTGDQKRQLRQKENEPDDNVVINLVKMAIQRTGDFLFPDVPSFELDPTEVELTPEERWIKDVIDYNGGLTLFHKLFLNGALGGHVFVRIMPADFIHPFPRALPIDPRTIVAYWRPDDRDVVVWYEITWQVGEDEYLLDVINETGQVRPLPVVDSGSDTQSQFVAGWRMKQYVRKNAAQYSPLPNDASITNTSQWVLQSQDFWPFVFGPIVQWPHFPLPNEFYGASEVNDLDLQDSVNLMFSEMMRINRYYASPRTVILGAEGEDIEETGSDKMWALPKEGAEVVNLEMKSELTAAREVAMFLHDAYLSSQRVVILRGEVKDFQRVTNVGVRTVFIDMLAKNKLLQHQYGSGLMKLLYTMALVSGVAMSVPRIIFSDPLPTDRLEQTNILAIQLNNQLVSRQQAATELGYDWNEQLTKMRQESKEELFKQEKPSGVASQTQPGATNQP